MTEERKDEIIEYLDEFVKTFSRDLQPQNALYSMQFTELGMLMLSRELHQENASYPMLSTESGMLMLLRDSQ